jgi:hypothetical protein
MDRGPSLPIEDERDRLNRNFAELLPEVRVARTGVQILFAFLLTLPFTAKFGTLGARDVTAYCLAMVDAALLAAFGVALLAAVFLVFDVVLGLGAAIPVAIGLGLVLLTLWYLLPMRQPPGRSRLPGPGRS